MPISLGVFHGSIGIGLLIAGFFALSIFLAFIISMRDQIVRAAPLGSSGLSNLLEASDLVHTWSEHGRLFPTSPLRWKAKFTFGTAATLFTFGFVLLFLGK